MKYTLRIVPKVGRCSLKGEGNDTFMPLLDIAFTDDARADSANAMVNILKAEGFKYTFLPICDKLRLQSSHLSKRDRNEQLTSCK